MLLLPASLGELGLALSLAVSSSSKVVNSASMSRLELDTFLLTMSRKSGGNLANKTGERRVPYDVALILSNLRLHTCNSV